MAKGDRIILDPGDYGVGASTRFHRISRVADERAGVRAQVGDADQTQSVRLTRTVPPAAIRLRVSQEGTIGRATLTGPITPIMGRWRRAMMRFYDITPGRGAYIIGRAPNQTRAFADPHTGRKRNPNYPGSVRPARIPHRLLPVTLAEGYTPRTWSYGDVKGHVGKPGPEEAPRVSYTQGVYRRRYRRRG